MMRRYRFYEMRKDQKFYLVSDGDTWTKDKKMAGLFTEQDWINWGSDGLERESLGEDEAIRLSGAPQLPGIEA